MIEEREVVPACRIIFQGGRPIEGELVVTDRQRRTEASVRIAIAPAVRPDVPKGALRQPLRQPVLPSYEPRRVAGPGRPRVAVPKRPKIQRPGTGKGSHWIQFPEATLEKIRELHTGGMIAKDIAKHFGCSIDLVFKRLRVARRESLEQFQVDETHRTCACGGRKWPSKEKCSYCLGSHKRKAAVAEKSDGTVL